MIEAIIFDAEGVILDTESAWDKGQEEFLRRRGFAYDRENTKHLLTGKSIVDGVSILMHQYGFDEDLAELASERIAIVRDFFESDLRFVAGFTEFYKKVVDHYKICIATALDEELLELAKRRMYLTSLFGECVFSIADVDNRSKPDPALFLYAARRLGSLPENCVVIEDAPHGIEAAKRAGMKCVALTTTYGPEKLAGADRIVESFTEVDISSLN